MFKEVSMEEAAVKAAQGEDAIMIWKDDKDMRFLDLKEEISGVFDVKGARYLIDVKEEEPKEEALPQPETPPPHRQGPGPKKPGDKPGGRKQKKVDAGKLRALYMAGWSQAKIADEMKISPASVSMYIKKFKEEEDHGTV